MTYNILDNFSRPITWHPNGAVCMQFDDGTNYDYLNTYPMLKARGMHCAFNIVRDLIGTNGRLTWAQCQEMSDNGFLICNHTDTHVIPFDGLTEAQKETELTACQTAIRANVITGTSEHPGVRGDYYVSFPGSALGSNADTITAMTNTGMRTGLESGFVGWTPKTTPPFELDYGNCDLSSTPLVNLYSSMDRIAGDVWAGRTSPWGGHGMTDEDVPYLTMFLDWLQKMRIPVITIDGYWQRQIA